VLEVTSPPGAAGDETLSAMEPSCTIGHLNDMETRKFRNFTMRCVIPVLAVCSLGVAACGTTHVGATRVGATRVGTAPGSSPRPSHSPLLPGCSGPVPPRHAWATEVSTDGHVRWQVRLPTFAANSDTAQSPVVVAGIAVFAQDGVVHGLRLADGHQLWSWAGGQVVYGMWPWQATVAVLTDQGEHPRAADRAARSHRPGGLDGAPA
jgi:hypothetical protein